MVSKGFKIREGEFTLEVTNIENITNDIQCVEYVVKRGDSELTDGFVYLVSYPALKGGACSTSPNGEGASGRLTNAPF